MKSIEVYMSKVNNREFSVVSVDRVDTVDVSCPQYDLPEENVYYAKCYILWGEYHRTKWKSSTDRRIYHGGLPQTACVSLSGVDKDDALSKLDNNEYEFKEWV